jgi:hypothetical protein
MEIVRISDIGGLQYASPAERRTRSIVRPGAFSRGRRALHAAPYTRSSGDRHPRRWWSAADQDCGRGGLPPSGRYIEARQTFRRPRRGSRYGRSTAPRLVHRQGAAMRALISMSWRRISASEPPALPRLALWSGAASGLRARPGITRSGSGGSRSVIPSIFRNDRRCAGPSNRNRCRSTGRDKKES